MSSLRSIQLWGIATKIITLAFGIIQTALILRILSPAEYGVVGIVMAVSALVGVSQHVGVVDATIREIATTDDIKKRAHIFWVSFWFRLIFTIPISLVLMITAPLVQKYIYNLSEISILLRVMSFILILQGIQGVMGGIYTGLRSFKYLYSLQIITSAINVIIFGYMTWRGGVTGFFGAVFITTLIFILLLSLRLRKTLGGSLEHPSRSIFAEVWREIFHTGFWTYISRIFSVAWQRLPILILGRMASPEAVGLFNAALTFGSKLTILASAIGEINLAFLSNAFSRGSGEFQKIAKKTINEVGVATLAGAGFLAVFADFFLFVFAGENYAPALQITVLVIWAYAAFAFMDIATNTIFVPIRRADVRAGLFAVLTASSMILIFFLPGDALLSTGYAVLAGGIISLAAGHIVSKRAAGIIFISSDLLIVYAGGIAMFAVSLIYPSFIIRLIVFCIAVIIMTLPFTRSFLRSKWSRVAMLNNKA